MSYIKQILEATSHKTAAVQPPISHLPNFYRRSKDELLSDVLHWTPSHRYAIVGQSTRIHLQQFCKDTGYCLEDLPEVMDDRNEWQERVLLAVKYDDEIKFVCLLCRMLFGLVLWYINLCRLFNPKSIFMHMNSSISNNSVYHKYTVLSDPTWEQWQ